MATNSKTNLISCLVKFSNFQFSIFKVQIWCATKIENLKNLQDHIRPQIENANAIAIAIQIAIAILVAIAIAT